MIKIYCNNCKTWINFLSNENPEHIFCPTKDLIKLKDNEFTYICHCGMAATFFTNFKLNK